MFRSNDLREKRDFSQWKMDEIFGQSSITNKLNYEQITELILVILNFVLL